MKKTALLAAAAAAVIATPALAHEGPYVGIIGGYDSVTEKVDRVSSSEDEIMYGVVAGYDMHVNEQVMAGIEVEYSDSDVKVDDEEFDTSLRMSRDLYIGGRLGVHATPSTMLYAKAGYTNAQAKLILGSDDTRLRASDNLDGFRVGAGVEHSFDQVGLRLEYRYSDYGNAELFGEDLGTNVSRHQVVAGILAKF